jgi:hypothetical protein
MRLVLQLAAGLLAASAASIAAAATVVHVAPGGNDADPGTEAKPLATIQAAVNRLQPGDTLLIHGGTYRETVTFPRSGAAERPITLRPYRDEKVLVSGCDPVTGWTLHDAGRKIWKAPIAWTLGRGRNQVFSGGRVMIEARYPNAPAPGLEMPVADLSPLWPTYGAFSIPRETRVSQPGRIVSKLLEGQPADYWKGALYCGVHFEGWCAQTGVIESSQPGEIHVGDRTQGWWFGSAYDGRFPQEHEEGRGMIVGHLHALDAPGEWHWQDNTLYAIAPDGGEPHAVEAKRRQLAFDLSGREHIRIEGLAIRAASLRLDSSAHCVVDRCELDYLTHYTHHYGIGQIEKGRDTIKSGETGIYVSGHDNAFLNCSVRVSAGAGFHLRGHHHTIHNCLIDEVSYVGHYLNAVTDAVGDFAGYEHQLVGGHVITFNTMRNAGRHFFNFYGNGTSTASRDRGPMDYAATLLAHNHLYNGMLLTRDAGFVTGYFGSGGTLHGLHSQVAYNVMHDCYDLSAMRWNTLGLIYLDLGTCHVDVHHNLFWAAPGSLQRDHVVQHLLRRGARVRQRLPRTVPPHLCRTAAGGFPARHLLPLRPRLRRTAAPAEVASGRQPQLRDHADRSPQRRPDRVRCAGPRRGLAHGRTAFHGRRAAAEHRPDGAPAAAPPPRDRPARARGEAPRRRGGEDADAVDVFLRHRGRRVAAL